MAYKIAGAVAGKDFEAELIKAVEDISTSRAQGSLKLASGIRIDFFFGTPYHAVAGDHEGMEALDLVLAAALAGEAFNFDDQAKVDRDKATVSLSSVRLVSRIKRMGEAGKPGAKAAAAPKALGKAAAAKSALALALDLALVADKLPLLPQGGDFPHDQNTIPAILFHLTSGIIDAMSPSLRGQVVVVDGRLVDAVAVVQDQFLQGPAALDAITLDTAKTLNVRTLDAAVAAIIPFFWKLPVRVSDLQARWVGGALAVQNFIKPDAWGVLQIRSDEDTALIYFSQGRILLSYSQAHPLPGTDLAILHSLLSADSAVITARVEDELPPAVTPATSTVLAPAVAAPMPVTPPQALPPTPPSAPAAAEPLFVVPTTPAAAPEVASAPETASAAVEPAPGAEPPPAPDEAQADAPPVATTAPVEPLAAAPAPAVESVPAVTPVVAPDATQPAPTPPAATGVTPPWAVPVAASSAEPLLDASVLERIKTMLRAELKFHAAPIEAEFAAAELTRSGLLKAAKHVRGLRPRLISPERMESICVRAINIITGREAA